jgi:hypothetical protein
MRYAILVLMGVALIIGSSSSEEAREAKGAGAPSFQPKPLDDDWNKWLVGEWEGLADSHAGMARILTKIELGLNGQFLIMKGEARITDITDEQERYLRDTLGASDEDIEKYRRSTFRELQIHTIDPKTGETIGYLFDSMRCIAQGRARRQGNKEITEWKWSANAQGATSVRIIERVNDNKFALHHKYTLPNGSKMEDRIEMARRK